MRLERGLTHDAEFERWASKVWNAGSDVPRSLPRNDIIIETFNESGQLARTYKVFRCWVSEYQALADLDANANAVAIQHIKMRASSATSPRLSQLSRVPSTRSRRDWPEFELHVTGSIEREGLEWEVGAAGLDGLHRVPYLLLCEEDIRVVATVGAT